MATTIYNGLLYTTKEINRNFRIKINPIIGYMANKNPKLKTADDLSDDLCLYCPLDDDEKGTHGVPNGYISCEGRCCQEAYEMYIEEWTE